MKTKRLREYKLQRTVSGGKPHSFIHSYSDSNMLWGPTKCQAPYSPRQISGPRHGLCPEGAFSQVAGSLLQPGEALRVQGWAWPEAQDQQEGARKGRGEGIPGDGNTMDKCYEDAGKDVFNMNAVTDLKKKEVWDLCLLFYHLLLYSFILSLLSFIVLNRYFLVCH